MKPQNICNQAGQVVDQVPPMLPTKYKYTKNLKPDQFSFCPANKLLTCKTLNEGGKTSKSISKKQRIILCNKYAPVDYISTYQYGLKTPDCLMKRLEH